MSGCCLSAWYSAVVPAFGAPITKKLGSTGDPRRRTRHRRHRRLQPMRQVAADQPLQLLDVIPVASPQPPARLLPQHRQRPQIVPGIKASQPRQRTRQSQPAQTPGLRGARVTLRARTTGPNPSQPRGTRTDHATSPPAIAPILIQIHPDMLRENNSKYTDR